MRDRDHEIKNNNPRNIFKVCFLGWGEMYLPRERKRGWSKDEARAYMGSLDVCQVGSLDRTVKPENKELKAMK